MPDLSVEFATLGDLKVVERPTTQNLGPRDFLNVQSTIKVSSTDTGIRTQQTLDRIFICLHMYLGVIFGNVVYDSPSGTDTHVVILNDVHADIMDYIQPATCSETAFRTMWTEFEWENKVNINKKNAGTLREFLDQLMKSTNMSCLTPEAGLRGDCQFLSANLYAKSVFGKLSSLLLVNANADIGIGEDALANLSIEKEGENGPITGFLRIRSRSQGLALSLGSLKGLKAGTS
jgi:coatomer subunit beta